MTNKEELIKAIEVLNGCCNMICPECELRLTCCKHIKTNMVALCNTAFIELMRLKNDN